MTCTLVRIAGLNAIVCHRGRSRRFVACRSRGCQADATCVCDYDLGGGRTCDLPICEAHAIEAGPDKHYCPRHAASCGIRPRQPDLFESVSPQGDCPAPDGLKT